MGLIVIGWLYKGPVGKSNKLFGAVGSKSAFDLRWSTLKTFCGFDLKFTVLQFGAKMLQMNC